jgi:ABC-2 type transport system ATP-binding protein
MAMTSYGLCGRLCVIDQGHVMAIDKPAALKAAYGRELLGVLPEDEAVAGAIRTSYLGALTGRDGAIAIEAGADAEAFVKSFGSRVRRLSIDSRSLERVFLSLSERELPDQPAGKRAGAYAFGQRGGEHRW